MQLTHYVDERIKVQRCEVSNLTSQDKQWHHGTREELSQDRRSKTTKENANYPDFISALCVYVQISHCTLLMYNNYV